ncbi:PBP1A family penicillin-binding protein [Lacticaseibacillus nasuensis]|uniref:Membrane carboxypeptidase n=1 Tax=Lacticaseibacillus nasuensis JCM 17158 TaxID=1291734 RepID=A0A0R1JY46_9LACO|nr:Membrane carboxypeptidase [Lacticaseibacillus nasuensis JCM 17158]
MTILNRVWAAIKPALKQGGHLVGWVFRRFQLIRWGILLVLTLILCASAWFTYQAKTADVQTVKSSLQTRTTLYDRKDKRAGMLYGQKGTYVELDKISPEVQNAVISTEDRSFYTNWGFSIKGILRSVLGLIIHHGQISGGGSTITQQLAKNTLLSQKQTFLRKAQELFLAVQLTKVYSKKDILTMYLNNAYFGNGVWGVEDASLRYFGKHASALTASEGATLAAMLRNPSYYNPLDHMDNAIARRNLVLGLMVDNGKLTAAQAASAKASRLTLKDAYTAYSQERYPYFFDAVIEEAWQDGISQDDIVNKGYKVYTTLDTTYQTQLQTAFDNDAAFPAAASDGTKPQAASVVVDPHTGGVMAVVGARGKHVYLGSNYATQLQRSPGSTIKPLMVYTPALENGYSYDSMLEDKKLSYGTNHYTPTNPTGQYLGKTPMYNALAQSLNAPAVWLLNKIGVQTGVDSLQRFGITLKKKDQNLAAALGGVTTGFSPLTMARAYSAFANGGTLPQTHFIRKIVDATGKTVVDNTKVDAKRIMKKQVATEMTSMMLGTFKYGTGVSAQPYGYTVAGKTGSTEVPDSWGYGTRDQWVVGYTPDMVVATWVGFTTTDANHFLQGTSESGVAGIFKTEMEAMLPYSPHTSFNTEDAKAKATVQADSADGSGDVWQSIGDGIKNGLDTAKSKVSQWYNDVKGLFGGN